MTSIDLDICTCVPYAEGGRTYHATGCPRRRSALVTDEMVARAAQAMARAGAPQDDWGPLTAAISAALNQPDAAEGKQP